MNKEKNGQLSWFPTHERSTPRNGGLLNFRVPGKVFVFTFGMRPGEPSPYGRPRTSNTRGFKKVAEKILKKVQ